LNHPKFFGFHRTKSPIFAEIPCFFPPNRELTYGDEFAEDCLHSQLKKRNGTRLRIDEPAAIFRGVGSDWVRARSAHR
jgi:hypothetical protein